MRRIAVVLLFTLFAIPVHAEIRSIDITIFGMD